MIDILKCIVAGTAFLCVMAIIIATLFPSIEQALSDLLESDK